MVPGTAAGVELCCVSLLPFGGTPVWRVCAVAVALLRQLGDEVDAAAAAPPAPSSTEGDASCDVAEELPVPGAVFILTWLSSACACCCYNSSGGGSCLLELGSDYTGSCTAPAAGDRRSDSVAEDSEKLRRFEGDNPLHLSNSTIASCSSASHTTTATVYAYPAAAIRRAVWGAVGAAVLAVLALASMRMVHDQILGMIVVVVVLGARVVP
eukprot:CAMPEP_0178988134 /NCGR_PEP_ID=MMETSP0795-20121207/3647_1 /TAXON_ID=88552 /ORGANISM="Amoebophrya sp., Strain Ameob2" /LENGTH=210 /DNA_ID=CAMNT_0020679385 /DNA_START=2000 /DNA_END=2634 /DNA_ORIENTATION=+